MPPANPQDLDAWLDAMMAKYGMPPGDLPGEAGGPAGAGDPTYSPGQDAEFVTSPEMPDMPLDQRMQMLEMPPSAPPAARPDVPLSNRVPPSRAKRSTVEEAMRMIQMMSTPKVRR